MFLEILGLIFVFVLLLIFPRIVGGICFWWVINAVYWPGDIQMNGDMIPIIGISFIPLVIVETMSLTALENWLKKQ